MSVDTKKIRASLAWKREYMSKAYGSPITHESFTLSVEDLEVLLDAYEAFGEALNMLRTISMFKLEPPEANEVAAKVRAWSELLK
jgi:hypothetical protein